MANTAQATKRARQARQRRERNIGYRTRFRTCQKRVVAAVASRDADAAKVAFAEFVVVADDVARRGGVHANKAARIKSRINASLRQLGAK